MSTCGKTRYPDQHAAAGARYEKLHHRRHPPKRFTLYHCHRCGGWHVQKPRHAGRPYNRARSNRFLSSFT